MIKFDAVSKWFGGICAIDDCSFAVPEGRVTGLIGPNGAGKTTAFNIIAGALEPDRGRVLLEGRDITRLPPHKRQTLGLGRTFQLAHEFSRMSVLENLVVAASQRQGESIVNAIFRPSRGAVELTAAVERAEELLAFLELSKLRDELAGNLSGGQKKLLELGRALMSQPKIVLLDEIGAGVNRTLLSRIAEKIEQLNRQEGFTFCLIEHDLDYVSRLCDHVIVMVQGQVLMEGTVDQVRGDERVIEAYFGGGKYEGRA